MGSQNLKNKMNMLACILGHAADTLRLEIRNVILMDCNHKPPISLLLLAYTTAPLQCW